MPTLTWGFLMLKFLRPKLKTQKLTYKPTRAQSEISQKIQPEKDRPKAVSKASPRSFKTRFFNNSSDP
jgi:hypothetical protein